MAAVANASAPSVNLSERRWAALALFVVSAAGLIFEITLTRMFSLFFQYHFTFLAVSLAVLGLSLGAACAHYLPLARAHAGRTSLYLLIILSFAFSAATLIIAWLPSVTSIIPRAFVALFIFFLIGVFDALTFERFAASSGTLYAVDLIGAAFGVMAVLWLLSVWSAFSMTLFLGVLVAGLAVLYAWRAPDNTAPRRIRARWVQVAVSSLVVAAGLFLVSLTTTTINFNPVDLSGAPRDKTMISILQDPAQNAHILYTAWSPFARVDVVQTGDPDTRYIFADGGAGAYMLRYNGDLGTLKPLTQTVEYLPYTAANADKVLVIGAGGGKDVLLAVQAQAHAITAVEVNPAIVAATRHFGPYNGNVLDLPQVDLVEGDARSYIERTSGQFDMIYLNLVYTQAVEPASQALVENYIFTRQAFRTYLDHLAPGGRLAIISHNALEGSRAAVTALQAMQESGLPPAQALDHVWLWMYPATDTTIRTSVLVIGKDALSSGLIQTLNTAARAQGMQPLYAPGDYETLFAPLRKGVSLAAFIQADASYNLSPTDDDQPYFFNLDYGLPPAIRTALLIAVLSALGMAGIALLARNPDRPGDDTRGWAYLGYMALIGMGFMLIEVPLIQRFQLLLGQPILSLAVILTTLLLAGGAGSAVSQHWRIDTLPSGVTLAGLWIAVVSVIYWIALPGWVHALLSASVGARLLATGILTALIGFPMGIPFSSLLRLAAEHHQPVALLWATNGAFSLLGSTLALVISIQWGFQWTLLGGAGVYLLVAGIAALLLRAKQTRAVAPSAPGAAAIRRAQR